MRRKLSAYPNKKRKKEEEQECIAFVARCKYHPILRKRLAHWPNGGSRHLLEAINLKKQGVKAGVSDYFLAHPVAPYHGLWLEMKRKNKKLAKISEAQQQWLDDMRTAGYAGHVAYGADEAWEICINYLRGES
jgi:hypothetical protein